MLCHSTHAKVSFRGYHDSSGSSTKMFTSTCVNISPTAEELTRNTHREVIAFGLKGKTSVWTRPWSNDISQSKPWEKKRGRVPWIPSASGSGRVAAGTQSVWLPDCHRCRGHKDRDYHDQDIQRKYFSGVIQIIGMNLADFYWVSRTNQTSVQDGRQTKISKWHKSCLGTQKCRRRQNTLATAALKVKTYA